MNKIRSKSNCLDYSKNWKILLPSLREEEKNSWIENKKISRKLAKKRKSNDGIVKENGETKNVSEFNDDATTSTSIAEKRENGVVFKRKMQNFTPNGSILKKTNSIKEKTSKKSADAPNLTKCLAIDCEFVGVGDDGFDDMVARVSLVNLFGDCIYDKFVKPKEDVVDYRTHVSGVRAEDLVNAETLKTIQKEVSDLIQGRILVGHAVKKDLQVLFLSHPKKNLRDTSKFAPFRAVAKTNRPSLKKLANLVLGVSIQEGEHDSIVDARVTMQLYRSHRNQWETRLRRRDKK